MATPGEKLAQSLEVLHKLQASGKDVFRSSDFTRVHQERLLNNGFLLKVLRGWYISARPDELPDQSSTWFTSFWRFAAVYLNERFSDDWCLSAEQSIQLHTGDWTVPTQLLVRSPKGSNKSQPLLQGTSLFDMRLALNDNVVSIEGMRVVDLATALIHCSPSYFTDHSTTIRAALLMLNGTFSDLLARLLAGGHSTVAGRLAGALRNIGHDKQANAIIDSMQAAGYKLSVTDPFAQKTLLMGHQDTCSPYVNRLRLLWATMRDDVLDNFPLPPSAPLSSPTSFLQTLDELFVTDAYHSLSIEGYQVSRALIERVQSGHYNPDVHPHDREQQNVLATKGYWQAFQAVKKSIAEILAGHSAAQRVQQDHAIWYRELFAPSVTAGLLEAQDLAGYRNIPVYIRCSRHVPPNYQAVRQDLMPTLFELLAEEKEAAVRAVLGHFIFVYIHPYRDGNGHIARFLMNAMLASGRYPWTVISVKERAHYRDALEKASVRGDIKPFSQWLGCQYQNAIR